MKKKILRLIHIGIAAAILFGVSSSAFAFDDDMQEESLQAATVAYKKGVDLTKAKAYESAISAFKEALKYNPEMYDAYYNIASIYVSQGKYDEAYNAYVKVIALNPHDYDSILQVAKISYNRKNYALALKYLKYIPEDYEYYYVVQQMQNDANELFDTQRNKIARAKVTTATGSKKVLIDKFNAPAGMAVDSEGNIFVACYSDNSIVKVDKNKKKTNFVKDYLLDGPIGLAIDNYDNIYVANFEANNILKITKGGNVSVFMDNISKPYFLYIKNDVLYISEQGNDVVLTYNLGGTR